MGFRPFVWQLARRFGLRGHVLNDPEGVLIIAAGDEVGAFVAALEGEAPSLSRVDEVSVETFDGEVCDGFEIVASVGVGAETRVTPDAATCPECLAEMRDPGDRRYGYAFANCTHCGPRFSILRGLPYDRAQTTMAAFDMCADCAAEYADPGDRRFHAQPVACAACGPRVWLETGGVERPVEDVAEVLANGGIVAIKGLGGFHLACHALDAKAVATLRDRKRRPAKPFALMGTMEMIRVFCYVSGDEAALLADPAAPVVLLERSGAQMPDAVAPGQGTLGWMLPYTPLHHVLFDHWATGPLVMTSGNLSGEPQVIGNDEAREKLAPFVDAFVMHDREIARRLDDSVERITPAGPMALRRARGRVPGTLPLPDGFEDAPQVVAYGGQMKGAMCLLKNGQALLGHHLGELDSALTQEAFDQADQDYAALFDHRPEVVAVDMHPDFYASRHGAARAEAEGLRLEEVQHHHAHLASCLAENGWSLDGGKVAAIVLDGLGLGPDGTVWGGEILLGDYRGYERRHWLQPVPLIGGDRAQAEPWRNALVRLDQAGLSDWADALFDHQPLAMARQAAAKGVNSPMSSSAGRLFDAVAACLGVCPDRQSFEGEAAMRLEALAESGADGYALSCTGQEIDPAPLFAALRADLAADVGVGVISSKFHVGLARAFAAKAQALVQTREAQAVVLTGGCFQNARLLSETLQALESTPVLIHSRVPANDGGLALGQAVIAAARAVSR